MCLRGYTGRFHWNSSNPVPKNTTRRAEWAFDKKEHDDGSSMPTHLRNYIRSLPAQVKWRPVEPTSELDDFALIKAFGSGPECLANNKVFQEKHIASHHALVPLKQPFL